MAPCPTDISIATLTEIDSRYQYCEGDTARFRVIWAVGTPQSTIAAFTYLWYRDQNNNSTYDPLVDIAISTDEGNDGILNDLIYTTAVQDGERVGVYITGPACGPGTARDIVYAQIIQKRACFVETSGCACLNNATDSTPGTFRDTLRIHGFPNQAWPWMLTAEEGMLEDISGTDLNAPLLVGFPPFGDSVTVFIIQHRDDIGYSGIISGIDARLFVSNGCSYPNPDINLVNIYCMDHPPIPLVVSEESGLGTPGPITLNGNPIPGNLYDPGSRIAGQTDTIRYSWISPDGCIQPALLLVQIDETPLGSIACQGQVNLSLGLDGIAEVTGDMLVPNRPCAASYPVDIIGLPGTVVSCAEVGQNFMVRVTNPADGSSCMGNVLVEDKIAPTIIQLIDTLPCTLDPYEVPDELLVAIDDNSCSSQATVSGQRVFYATYCANQDSLVVTWTATDNYGNTSVETFSYYWAKPALEEIDFPDTLTQSCSSGSLDTAVTGVPTFEGLPPGYFCSYNVSYTDGVRIKTSCPGNYYIRRTWEVEDWCTWETRTEVQILNFIDTVAPQIVCPQNITLSTDANYCQANYTLPDIAAQSDCSGIRFKRFDIAAVGANLVPGQSIVLPVGIHPVHVTVSDSCGNLSTCAYEITVRDLSSPVVICQDVNISLNNLGLAVLNPGMMLADAYDNCALALNPYRIKRLGEPDAAFRDTIQYTCSQEGINRATIRVYDAYGNYTDCTDTITVIDSIIPVITCPDLYEITLDTAGLAQVAAADIPEVTGNSCNGVLSYSFSHPLYNPVRVYTCDSLAPADIHVFIYLDGTLIGSCANIDPIVHENPDQPCDGMKISISGRVFNPVGKALQGVSVDILGQPGQGASTDADGQYTIPALQPGQNISLRAGWDRNPAEGVSTQDLVYITKHMLNKETFSSPYQWLAADVDMNGLIAAADLVALRKLILGIETTFPKAPAWQFYKAGFDWSANPLQDERPVYQSCQTAQTDLEGIDFVGVKTGDVSLGADGSGLAGLDQRNGRELTLQLDKLAFEPGESKTLALRIGDTREMEGFQGTLSFDPAKLRILRVIPAHPAMGEGCFAQNKLESGRMAFSWNSNGQGLEEGDVLCYLECEALLAASSEDLFGLTLSPTPGESYFANGSRGGLELRFTNAASGPATRWALYQNTPNPAQGETRVRIDAPVACLATCQLYDLQGRELSRIEMPLSPGANYWPITGGDLPAAGLYFYSVETPYFKAVKKMQLLR